MKFSCMTFNLRVAAPQDGKNYFFLRKKRVLKMIRSEEPDIIGFQEANREMRKWLKDKLKGYVIVGCGRNSDFGGESSVIAYSTERFEMLSLENKWLSPTPDVPGSTYGEDQSEFPRMFTSAVLSDRTTGQKIRVINTHFDHIGSKARCLEANQICGYILTKEEQFVFTGDLNAEPDSEEIGIINDLLKKAGARDCTEGMSGTYHGFGRLKEGKEEKIDYVFSNISAENAEIVADAGKRGRFYSDHYAVKVYFDTDKQTDASTSN